MPPSGIWARKIRPRALSRAEPGSLLGRKPVFESAICPGVVGRNGLLGRVAMAFPSVSCFPFRSKPNGVFQVSIGQGGVPPVRGEGHALNHGVVPTTDNRTHAVIPGLDRSARPKQAAHQSQGCSPHAPLHCPRHAPPPLKTICVILYARGEQTSTRGAAPGSSV